MEIAAYLDVLDNDGVLLADAAERAGLTAAVPGCPGWQVRDLVRHQAYVHGWAAQHVRERRPELIDGPAEADILGGGPPDGELIAAYRLGHAALVATLRSADPDVACATFMPSPSPLAFWARRQAHETAVHSYDARSAGPGGPPDPVAAFGPEFAADGIDELIMCFTARRRYRLRGNGTHSLAVRPSDVPDGWRVRLADGSTEVSREVAVDADQGDADQGDADQGDADQGGGAREADCVLDGPAAGLYAFLWNRCDPDQGGVTISGDPSILVPWSASVRITY